ncbi:trimeric intracellular cation channel family protein [Hydrogenimonas urashimensis]|uniref:trimeric intracellular cation channel family protein n=1 Tax=Hydrogenimonas urashimensis TaxID=2740515 RepID=UPI001915778D|nr:trimeric intracellular cation channel family protein [Hydrogenimonas urashimensis]
MTLFAAADAIGLATFSISGLLMGMRKGLDLLGILITAFLTALGGGVIRDVIVGRTPLVFEQSATLLYVIAGILLALLLRLHAKERPERYAIFILMDSIGLVAFALTGALVGIESGFNLFGVMLLSFVTAVGGGMLRDMMLGDIPIVLTSDFYGTIALLVAFLIYLCERMGCLGSWTLFLVGVSALILRLVAYRRNWHLPKLGEKP